MFFSDWALDDRSVRSATVVIADFADRVCLDWLAHATGVRVQRRHRTAAPLRLRGGTADRYGRDQLPSVVAPIDSMARNSRRFDVSAKRATVHRPSFKGRSSISGKETMVGIRLDRSKGNRWRCQDLSYRNRSKLRRSYAGDGTFRTNLINARRMSSVGIEVTFEVYAIPPKKVGDTIRSIEPKNVRPE